MKDTKKGLNSFGLKGWWVVIFVGLLYYVSSNAVDLLNVTTTLFAQVKGWDENALLVFSGLGGWVGVILTLIFGRWIAKKGVKLPTVIFLVIFAVLYFLNGRVNSVATYGVVVVLLSAVSNSINLVSTNAYMSNWFPRKKGIALGWSTMGAPISSATCIAIFTGIFAASHGSLANPFLFFAILTLVVAIVALLAVKATPKEAGAYPDNDPAMADVPVENPQSPWTVKKLLGCKNMWFVAISFGLLFMALVATMTQFIPRMMASGFTMDQGTMWLSIASILGIPGSYLWGVLDQKGGTKLAVIVFAIYMAAMQFLLAIFFGNQIVTLILIVLLGILIGGICNLLPSMVIQIFGGRNFAAVNSVVTPIVVALRTTTFIVMPAILGATHGSFQALSVFYGVLSVIAMVLAIFMTKETLPEPEAK